MKWILVLFGGLLLFGCGGQHEETVSITRHPVAADTKSAISLYLDESARILTARSNDGKTLWSVDVIKECGVPAVGKPKIRHVTIQGGQVSVVFGKHDFATVDLKSGSVQYQGAD